MDGIEAIARAVDEGGRARSGAAIEPGPRYLGVTRRHNRWVAQIRIRAVHRTGGNLDHKTIYLGCHETAEEAARAYDRGVDTYRPGDAKNFPGEGHPRARTFAPRHGYYGVYPRGDRFVARLWYRRKFLHFGSHPTALDAARAHDEAVRSLKLDRPLNFPEEAR